MCQEREFRDWATKYWEAIVTIPAALAVEELLVSREGTPKKPGLLRNADTVGQSPSDSELQSRC